MLLYIILIILILSLGHITRQSYKLKTVLKTRDLQLLSSTDAYTKLLNQKKSSEIMLGRISEQLAPFLDSFGYEPDDLHFIGQPIDYICFTDDKIIFIEVKSGKSRLTSKQKNIKELVKNGQVFWDEFRVSGTDENSTKDTA